MPEHCPGILGLQGAEGKVREGVSSLAEVRRQAGQHQEEANTAMQAQQAATQAAQHQLKAAQVLHCQTQVSQWLSRLGRQQHLSVDTALPDPNVKVGRSRLRRQYCLSVGTALSDPIVKFTDLVGICPQVLHCHSILKVWCGLTTYGVYASKV